MKIVTFVSTLVLDTQTFTNELKNLEKALNEQSILKSYMPWRAHNETIPNPKPKA